MYVKKSSIKSRTVEIGHIDSTDDGKGVEEELFPTDTIDAGRTGEG